MVLKTLLPIFVCTLLQFVNPLQAKSRFQPESLLIQADVDLQTSGLGLEFKESAVGLRFTYQFRIEPKIEKLHRHRDHLQILSCKNIKKNGLSFTIESAHQKTQPPPPEWYLSPYSHDGFANSKVSEKGIEHLRAQAIPQIQFCIEDDNNLVESGNLNLIESKNYQLLSIFHSSVFPSRSIDKNANEVAYHNYSLDGLKQAHTSLVFEAISRNPSPNKLAEYVKECTTTLGPIPNFSCDEGVEVPVMETSPLGTRKLEYNDFVSNPNQKCNTPAWLGYSDYGNQCSPYSRIGRLSGENGSEFIFFCRKYFPRPATSELYDDINMIGHNPTTGSTCFFNSKVNYRGPEHGNLGKNIPALSSENALNFWLGIGPLASNRCAESCHSNDPFLHTPIVDQLNRQGQYVGNCIVGGNASDCFVPSYPTGKYEITHNPVFNWHRFILDDSTYPACTGCHRLATKVNLSFAAISFDPTIASSVHLNLFRSQLNPHAWMPPTADYDKEEFGLTTAKLMQCLRSISQCLGRLISP